MHAAEPAHAAEPFDMLRARVSIKLRTKVGFASVCCELQCVGPLGPSAADAPIVRPARVNGV